MADETIHEQFGPGSTPLVPDAAEIARLTARVAELENALIAMTDWVVAALDCEAWHWDGDQREAAENDLAAALRAMKETAK
jgi:hypothetical protein